MGHIAHLKNQFKSINTFAQSYIYIVMLNWRDDNLYYLLFDYWMVHCEFPSLKDALCQIWLKLAQWFWIRRSLTFVNVFLLFHNYLSFSKGACGLSFEQTIIPFTQGCFVPSLIEIGPMILEKKILNFVNVFYIFRNYLLLEK